MRRLLLFAVLIAFVTLTGFWASQKMCSMAMCPMGYRAQGDGYSNLGLSAKQVETLKKLDSAFRKSADQICIKVCKGRFELLRMLENPKADGKVIDQKVEEIGALQIALEKEVAKHILEVRKELTPEQTEKYLTQLRAKLQESMKQMNMGNLEMGTVRED